MPEPMSLNGLNPLEYEHPFDAKALDALQKTPGLDLLVRQWNKLAIERYCTILYTGSNLKVTKDGFPKIHRLLDKVCEVLNLAQRPALYLEWGYHINGFTIGVENPIIVLTSGAIDLLDEGELLYLIGHEVGHIKSRHTLYHQMGSFLPVLADKFGRATLGLGELLSAPLQLALLWWQRMSELTADRAGLLASQDIDLATRVMMKWSGMPLKYYGEMQFETFVQQAKEFEALDYNVLNRAVKYLTKMESTHPWTVMRAAELLRWIEGGDFHRILKRQTTDRVFKKYEGNLVFCRKCGLRLDGPERFCPTCGSQLRELANSQAEP
jgi:Zn-dependent protease with chaperone function